MSLQKWLINGWLKEHRVNPKEIAALQAATAALAASGYRAVREAYHYRVIQSLAHTLKTDPDVVALFDQFRKKRNISGYDQAGMISDHEANEMTNLAKRIRREIEEWRNERLIW